MEKLLDRDIDRQQTKKHFSWTACPETSIRNQNYTSRNFPEERRSQLHRGGSLKLHKEGTIEIRDLTYLITYLPTYLPTYLTTYLLTNLLS